MVKLLMDGRAKKNDFPNQIISSEEGVIHFPPHKMKRDPKDLVTL